MQAIEETTFNSSQGIVDHDAVKFEYSIVNNDSLLLSVVAEQPELTSSLSDLRDANTPSPVNLITLSTTPPPPLLESTFNIINASPARPTPETSFDQTRIDHVRRVLFDEVTLSLLATLRLFETHQTESTQHDAQPQSESNDTNDTINASQHADTQVRFSDI